jgi:hypothetical protein
LKKSSKIFGFSKKDIYIKSIKIKQTFACRLATFQNEQTIVFIDAGWCRQLNTAGSLPEDPGGGARTRYKNRRKTVQLTRR